MTARARWTHCAAAAILGAAVLVNPGAVRGLQDQAAGPSDAPVLESSAPPALLQGVVADEQTMTPISSATISVIGMDELATSAASNGTFAVPDAPLGTLSIRAVAPGYASTVQQVEVREDRVVFVQFLLPTISAVVDGIIVDGRRLSDPIESGPELTAADLLALRVPSTRRNSGEVGKTDYGIGFRAPTSLTQGMNPVVLVDGIRVGDADDALFVLSQIPASEVESMEILKGPSSASAFTSFAANGVISIHTRYGQTSSSDDPQ